MTHKNISIAELQQKAKAIRMDIVTALSEAGSGHTGGSLGLADVFTYLYFQQLNHQPNQPDWDERDRMILSIGHVAPVLYTTLAHARYFPVEELKSLRKLGSRLQGHPGRDHGLPGLELSAGSLGQGLSVAVGMALAAKHDNKSWKTYCIMGDGELQEGSIWEAAMAAGHHQLGNLIGIVDRNYVQIDGQNEKVMNIEPLADKWKAFGWQVHHCNGNSMQDLHSCFSKIDSNSTKPQIIIAETKMGKGVADIEDNYQWHGKAPSKEQLADFIKQIQNGK